MNALTKVLVVLVLLLSVGFAVSQMVLYSKRENFGLEYQKAAKLLKETKAQREQLAGELKDIRVRLDTVKNDLEGQVLTLKNNFANEKAHAQDLDVKVERLHVSVNLLTNRASKLEGDIETLDRTNEDLRQTVSDREQAIQDGLGKIEGLQATVAERDNSIGTLNHKLTELKKVYTELALDEERLEAIVGELVQRGFDLPPAPLPIINGRVIRVNVESKAAVVDKGDKDGVKPNTEFTVYSGSDYVARLIIHDVQPDVSVGLISLLAKGRQVAQGDKVTTQIP